MDKLPNGVRSARKEIRNTQEQFEKYVCCPECSHLYDIQECVVRNHSGRSESKRCSFVKYPSHPQAQHCKPCGTVLMKEVKCRSPDVCFYPKSMYCYRSVIHSMREMLQ